MTQSMEVELVAGLDLGKLSDPTAFTVFRRTRPAIVQDGPQIVDDPLMGRMTTTPLPMEIHSKKREQEGRRWTYTLTILKRFEIGTKYKDISSWLAKAYSRSPKDGGLSGTMLAVDKTGVGNAVVEMISEDLKGAKAKIRPITITGGGRAVEDAGDGLFGWRVPKKELVSVLQMLMGTERLLIDPRLPLATVLIKEFENFKSKINEATGNESFEAWRESDHDDCVLACALILWLCERGQKEFWLR